jgi:hypothetical protein
MDEWKSANWKSFAPLPKNSTSPARPRKCTPCSPTSPRRSRRSKKNLVRRSLTAWAAASRLPMPGATFCPSPSRRCAPWSRASARCRPAPSPAGRLRVGIPESMLTYRLPQVLRIFHRRFPHVELIFRPQWDEVLPVMLENGKLDMAVCMIEKRKPRCLCGVFLSVNCWDWTKAIALPRVPRVPAVDFTAGQPWGLGRDALGLSHLTYDTSGTINLHQLDQPPFPCKPKVTCPKCGFAGNASTALWEGYQLSPFRRKRGQERQVPKSTPAPDSDSRSLRRSPRCSCSRPSRNRHSRSGTRSASPSGGLRG